MFLNVWGGGEEGLLPYIKKVSESVDVFCLQEVHRTLINNGKVPHHVLPTRGKRERHNNIRLYNDLELILSSSHIGFYAPHMRGLHDLEGESEDFIDYGLACFTKVALRPETVRAGMLHRQFGEFNDGQPASRNIVSFTVKSMGKRLLIAQMHGLWDESGKRDIPARFIQSRKAAAHIANHRRDEAWGADLPVVFGGDFNLTSDCMTLTKLIEGKFYGRSGGECLNHKFGVTDTRTPLYKKPVREADFVLASRSLQAKLTVDRNVPSDHAALIVEV